VLADLDGLRSDSDTEHDLRRDLIELGYPVHPEPFPFRCDDDVVVHLDLALPAHWVYLEVDGFGTHRTRRVFEADRVKWTQIVRHWQPVWVTASRWEQDRSAVLADLDAAIADADPNRAPAVPQP
jgi:very-short-patch-repair endonuclease